LEQRNFENRIGRIGQARAQVLDRLEGGRAVGPLESLCKRPARLLGAALSVGPACG
jgi:hypothetical protein